jgi:serine/threonine protein kinase
MQPSRKSPIGGLDPAGLLGLAATTQPSGGGWTPPGLEQVAKLFPQWSVRSVLGRGGMGAVYLAHQADLDRDVAIKLLPIESSADEPMVERFRREARTLARLKHPGIVSLHEAGVTTEGHFFFVMEYVKGRPLSELIHAGRLSTTQVIEIVREVCDALAYAHEQGVVHRDIKPSNILIDDQGHAHVADFGLARADSTTGGMTLSQTGAFMGTPEYAAPEQAKDATRVDHRADIYSLGVLLYEMLTGELPRGIFQPPSSKAGADQRFDKVVHRALQERPEDRYQQASELKADMMPRKGTSLVWLVVLMLLMLAGWLGWQWWGALDREDAPTVAIVEKPTPQKVDSSVVVASGGSSEAVSASLRKTEGETPSVRSVAGKSEVMEELPKPAPPPSPVVAKREEPKPMPAPAVVVSHPPKAWSLTVVEPDLLPPTAILDGQWVDVSLSAVGGAVLAKDGSFKAWGSDAEERTNVRSMAAAPEQVVTIPSKPPLYSVFASACPGKIAGLSLDDWIVELDLASSTVTPLVPMKSESVATVMMTIESDVWVLFTDGRLGKVADGAVVISGNDFTAIGSTGTGLLALKRDGSIKAIEGAPAPPATLKQGEKLITAVGHAAVIERNGKVTIWGPSVEDSPQRFSLTEGHQNLAISPRGVVVTW